VDLEVPCSSQGGGTIPKAAEFAACFTLQDDDEVALRTEGIVVPLSSGLAMINDYMTGCARVACVQEAG
jgi:hypothetical protein